MRYTPCKSASEGRACRMHEKRPLIPTSSQPRSLVGETLNSSPSKSDYHVFTFFADAVTSTPPHSFSSPPVRQGRPGSYENSPLSSPLSPQFAAPERYLYPREEDEESDIENYLPSIEHNFSGPRLFSNPRLEMHPGIDVNTVTIIDTPVLHHYPSTPPQDGMLLDRFSSSSPMSEEPEIWGQGPPVPPPMTRTGRPARHASVGRWFPSLSSGLGGGMYEEPQHTSFYERQLRVASERETQDSRPGSLTIHEESQTQPQVNTNVVSPIFSLDSDGELVAWGASVQGTSPDSRARRTADFSYDQMESDAEYKPADWNFIER